VVAPPVFTVSACAPSTVEAKSIALPPVLERIALPLRVTAS
jgi:hypothetical protein